jgi:nucleoside-diphosphate-sugar epimerase
MKVLLTGPSGRIGPQIIDILRTNFEVLTFDLPGRGADFEGDLSNIDTLRHAMKGVDSVIHLAATSDEAPFLEELLPNNVIGAYNVFEAARLEGLRRIVFASSVQAGGGVPYKREGDVTSEIDMLPRPGTLYGASKVLGESMGRFFYNRYGIEFVALRLGAFQPYDSDWLKTGQGEEIWLSPRDCAGIIKLAVEKPGVKYAVVNATSKTSKEVLPLQSAHEALGFVPQDDSRDFFSAETFKS